KQRSRVARVSAAHPGPLAHSSNGTVSLSPGCAALTRATRLLAIQLAGSAVDGSFDAVPVRVNQERRVVLRAIVRAQSRRTVVMPTDGQCLRVEVINRRLIGGGEGQMK